ARAPAAGTGHPVAERDPRILATGDPAVLRRLLAHRVGVTGVGPPVRGALPGRRNHGRQVHQRRAGNTRADVAGAVDQQEGAHGTQAYQRAGDRLARRQGGGTIVPRRTATVASATLAARHTSIVTTEASGPNAPPLSQSGPVSSDCSQPCGGKPDTEVPYNAPSVTFHAACRPMQT